MKHFTLGGILACIHLVVFSVHSQPITLCIACEGTNRVEVSWNTVPGEFYLLDARANLSDAWQSACEPPGVFGSVSNSVSECFAADGLSQFFRVRTVDVTNIPPGMALVPSGTFYMGDAFAEGSPEERPVHPVFVTAFYVDRQEVTEALWDEVKSWSWTNGYSYTYAGSGKAINHPVHTVDWFDAVKWCNARSEMEGLTPTYYVDSALTQPYRAGQVAPYVLWDADGYRLPTEAEWEKAARGGTGGHRFPWTDADTITHSRANYYSSSSFPYDLSPTNGYHPTYAVGGPPYTSPVGSFASNGYGLDDMAGNVWEWCWDWYDPDWYSGAGATQKDPHGPSAGTFRVVRGGAWAANAGTARCAFRYAYSPISASSLSGFRCVRRFQLTL